MHCEYCGGDIHEGQPALLQASTAWLTLKWSHVFCTLRRELLSAAAMGTTTTIQNVKVEHTYDEDSDIHGLSLTIKGVPGV